jgi:hypothetical protein
MSLGHVTLFFFVHLILIRRLKQAHQPAFPELYFDKCPANALKIEDWSNGKQIDVSLAVTCSPKIFIQPMVYTLLLLAKYARVIQREKKLSNIHTKR